MSHKHRSGVGRTRDINSTRVYSRMSPEERDRIREYRKLLRRAIKDNKTPR